MLKILKEEGMPPELINLALIESGFYSQAYSRAGAVGFWQFIESTGDCTHAYPCGLGALEPGNVLESISL